MNEFEYQPNRLLRLLSTAWPLFRAFRVTVRVSWTIVLMPLFFLVIFRRAELAWNEALLWAPVCTIALFTSVWTHEMGHVTAGRRFGIETETITLRALGGLAHLDAPGQTPREDMLIALAGPATHFAWMAVLFPATWMLESGYETELWFAMLRAFAFFQVTMTVFNLLPIWPCDGGRAMRGALALKVPSGRASYWTANVGFVGNGLLIALGLVSALGVVAPVIGASYGGGLLLIWLGIDGIRACIHLRREALYGDAFGDHDPFAKTLLASQAAGREEDRQEQKERDSRRATQDERRQLQETADALLDRINEVGGVDKLSVKERRELERVSKKLSE